MPQNDQERILHPFEKANLLSRAFFVWMLPVLWRGFKEQVDISDIPITIPEREESLYTGGKLEKQWNRELNKDPSEGRPKLFSALLRTHAKHIVFTSVVSTFCDVVIKTWQAVSLGQMIYHSSRLLFGRTIDTTHTNGMSEDKTDSSLLETVAATTTRLMSDITIMYHNSSESNSPIINSNTTGSVASSQLGTHHLMSDRWSIHEPLVQWTLSLMISTLIFPILIHNYCFEMMRLGIQIRVATSYLIFRKAVKLSHAALAQSTIGQMVNLLSNDVDRFDLVVIFIPFIWIAPIQVLLTMAILWSIIGSTSLTLLVILFIFMCIQSYLSQKFSYYRTTIANLTDIRARYINEVITAIRVVKTYAWEKHWHEKITKARNNEMRAIKDVSFYRAINQAVGFFSSKIIVFSILAMAASSGSVQNSVMNPWNVFLIISLLNNVQSTISRLLPQTISFWSEMMVSIKRIEEFLLLEERGISKSIEYKELSDEQKINLQEMRDQIAEAIKRQHLENSLSSLSNSRLLAARSIKEQLDQQLKERNTDKRNIRVYCDRINASWTEMETTPSLIDLTFKLRQNELLIVCGSVASGKSSLLLALLGECPLFNGKIKVSGKLGYASQQPWIFAGTVRDNILFGEPFESKRYTRVLSVCALSRDLQLFENGDQTWISEKGSSLSGGQKARINLARCLYRDSDIYLLDDPLSAVDSNVSKHLFFKAIKGFLKYKSVILVTHHVEYLKHADNILLLNHGKALAYGNFKDIRKHFIDFLDLSQALIRDKSPIRLITTSKKVPDIAPLGSHDNHATTTADGAHKDLNLDSGAKSGPAITSSDTITTGANTNINTNNNQKGSIVDQANTDKSSQTGNATASVAVTESLSSSNLNATIEQQMAQKDKMEAEKLNQLFDSVNNDKENGSKQEASSMSSDPLNNTLNKDTLARIEQSLIQKNSTDNHSATKSAATTTNSEDKANPDSEHHDTTTPTTTPLSNSTTGFSPSGTGAALGQQVTTTTNRVVSSQHSSPRSSFKKSPKEIHDELRESNAMRTEAMTEYLALPVIGITNGPTSRSMSLIGGINSGEQLHTGSVKFRVWLQYLTIGSRFLFVLTVISFLMSQIFYTAIDGYLSVWTNIEQQRMTNNFTDANVNPNYRGLYHMVMPLTRQQHIITYMALIIILTLFSLLKNLAFFGAANRSAEYFHAKLLKGAIYAHMSYFDKNPIGVILNRATRDMGVIDEILPVALFTAVEILLQLLATLCLITSVDYYLAIPSLLLLMIILCFHRFFVGASRDLKRLENIARSPIFSHLASTLEGLATIRACQHEYSVEEQYVNYQNEHTSIFFYYIGARRWLAITLDSLNAVYIATLCIWCISYIADGSAMGLMISSAILMCGLMQFGFFKLAETEAFMTSVERVMECIDLKQEENYDQDNDFGQTGLDDDEDEKSDDSTDTIFDLIKNEKNAIKDSNNGANQLDKLRGGAKHSFETSKDQSSLTKSVTANDLILLKNSGTLKQLQKSYWAKQKLRMNISGKVRKQLRWITNVENKKIKLSEWPQSGNLQFINVTLAYNRDEKPVLHNLSFSIQSGERVGIVGRTGAGKTSIITTLFRLYNYVGQIIIDSVDTKKLALKRLREKLSIIPQDPIIFTGSFRNNVDPFDQYTDSQIWKALEQVHLKETVSRLPQGLASHLTEGGHNLSAGQKQLVCLARTLLKNNRILVLDEATANVDHETDTLIQDAMRTQFVGCTVLTIAHRLNTIIDYDKVLVMDGGRVVEYGEPYTLLQKIDGIFTQMVSITGKRSAANLKSLAKVAYESRHGNMMTDETLSTVNNNEAIKSFTDLNPAVFQSSQTTPNNNNLLSQQKTSNNSDANHEKKNTDLLDKNSKLSDNLSKNTSMSSRSKDQSNDSRSDKVPVR